jgi:hypothetical protein
LPNDSITHCFNVSNDSVFMQPLVSKMKALQEQL